MFYLQYKYIILRSDEIFKPKRVCFTLNYLNKEDKTLKIVSSYRECFQEHQALYDSFHRVPREAEGSGEVPSLGGGRQRRVHQRPPGPCVSCGAKRGGQSRAPRTHQARKRLHVTRAWSTPSLDLRPWYSGETYCTAESNDCLYLRLIFCEKKTLSLETELVLNK